MSVARWLVIAAMLWGVPELSAQSPTDETRIAPLRGILAIRVEVWVSDSAKTQLSEDRLRTAVELRLRMAGVRVLTDDEWHRDSSATAFLLVTGYARRDYGERFVYNVQTEFRDRVRLPRQPRASLYAALWELGDMGIGTTTTSDLAEDMLSTARNQADGFLNAYLAANPPKVPVARP